MTSSERPEAELVASCRALYSGLLPAVTVLGADWRIRSAAADVAEPGDGSRAL